MNVYGQEIAQINFCLLLLLAFCLPLSTSAVSVTALLIMVCWLIEGGFREKFQEIVASPICIAVLVYVGVLIVGLCWSDSLPDGLGAIKKQWKVLLVPIFLTTIRWERRWWYVTAFVAGVTVTMLLIFLDYFQLLQVIDLSSPDLHFRTETVQLSYAPMLAFTIYLLLHQLLWSEVKGLQWWSLSIFTVLLVVNMFITRGRAGYAAFFALLTLLLFQYFRRNVLKAFLLVVVMLPLLFFTAYHFSPVFQGRMDAIRQDLETLNENTETPVGQRLHYWQVSWAIIKESPWGGVGTGDFSRAYIEMNNRLSPTILPTNNPHNQYIFATAQLGVLGLLSLLGLLVAHFYQAARMTDGLERIRIAFPLFFMVIMCFESYLNLSGTGFLFSLLSAILFKNAPRHLEGVPL
ncbi:O-antigen ligase family protein [uncultured Desulfobulbus sp.]|uniref:O-antigen ligase family protein n=1 Tax=uncultured Desulfobulbus sp. TaxID=239745 RepID=UPI0029C655B1|nr:O-antigen ligase family protein [uncultured Desulfobulbus sp.]